MSLDQYPENLAEKESPSRGTQGIADTIILPSSSVQKIRPFTRPYRRRRSAKKMFLWVLIISGIAAAAYLYLFTNTRIDRQVKMPTIVAPIAASVSNVFSQFTSRPRYIIPNTANQPEHMIYRCAGDVFTTSPNRASGCTLVQGADTILTECSRLLRGAE